MLWSTSMEIPVGAPNPQAAQAFIDYVYDPKVRPTSGRISPSTTSPLGMC